MVCYVALLLVMNCCIAIKIPLADEMNERMCLQENISS